MDEKKQKFKSVKKAIMVIVAIILVGGGVYIGMQFGDKTSDEGDVVGLEFKNIGELATQSALCTDVGVIKKDRKLFGTEISIPFTESQYIYRYAVNIYAGYDFSKIKWKVNDDKKIIEITFPEVKILSAEYVKGSFKVYYKKESLFKDISLEDYETAREKLVERSKEKAVKNGLYTKARENAEILVRDFVGQTYDLKEYKIEFTD